MIVLDVPKHIVNARQEMVAAVKTRLGPEFFSHAVVLARTPTQRKGSPEEGWKYLVGTGTLVQVNSATGGPRYGVLTCGHVLGAFDQAPEGTQPGSLTLLLATVVGDRDGRPQAATIPYLEHSAVVVGAGNEKSTGPDLAWLPLAAEDARALQSNARSRAVFYNLAAGLRTSDELKAHVRAHGEIDPDEYLRSHVSMAVGWNKEIHTRDPARGGIWMNEVVHDSDSALNGWHFADYRINDDRWTEQIYGDGTRLPSTWQGLSGGSVWHVWRPDATENRYEKMLRGVVFYEIRQSARRSMTIRTHGEVSVLRLLHRAGIAPPGTISEEEIVASLLDAPRPPVEPLA